MKMGILVASTVAAAAVATVASADFAFGNQIAIIGSAWSASGSQTTWGGGYQLGIDAAFDASSGQPWFVGVSSQVVNPNKVVFSIDFSHFDIATNTFYTIDLSGLKSDGSIASVTPTDATVTNYGTKIEKGELTITIGDGATNGGTVVDLGEIRASGSGAQRLGDVVAAINNKSADTGVTAFLTKKADGEYSLEFVASKLDGSEDPPKTPLQVQFTGTAWGVGSTGFDQSAVTIAEPTNSDDLKGIDTLKIDTQKDAWVALKKIDSAIDQINSARADLGALQSRFENSVNNIDIQVENISASRGRIVDADFAKETANLSRTQILQQAGVAMVAQSNQLPQQVLSLLR